MVIRKHFMKYPLLILLIVFTSGCSIFNFGEDNDNHDYAAEMGQDDPSTVPLQSSLQFQKHFKSKLTNKETVSSAEPKSKVDMPRAPYLDPSTNNINHYVKTLTDELMSNLKDINSNTPVAVVSFVMLDSDYNQSSLLGNQIAESLIHEIHTNGIPVIDFKTTGYVRVTEQGDFAFSKDYEDFDNKLPADFVVGGTLLKHKEGYLINARIIDFASKSVMATAQNFIPNEVADALLAKSHVPGIEQEVPQKSPENNRISLISN